METVNKRKLALDRASELKGRINDYLSVKDEIPTGRKMKDMITDNKQRILKILNGTEKDWDNWIWQMQNTIRDVNILDKIIDLTDEERQSIIRIGENFRWAISPYYASLIDPKNHNDPIRLQAVPHVLEENDQIGKTDPMGEEVTSPADNITRRYPDRLIINVTNQCPMYCRHCQRRRNIGQVDLSKTIRDLEPAVEYIRNNPEIRDVLITGGDALMLPEKTLDWLLTELDNIEHVEIKRLGTRCLVTLPQRITPQLCDMLSKHHPLYLNTHFNHPQEITEEVAHATEMLSRAGIPLGNQAVLLKGINNDAHIMKKLNHELLKVRIRPYYIFHAKAVAGTTHFITKIEEGIEIMEKLRGYTSGLAIPTYIVNAPLGQGKTPILPEYTISQGKDYVLIRTWEGKIIKYRNGSVEI